MEKQTEIELLRGCETEGERCARLGRMAVLLEMGFFGDETNMKLARGEYRGRFHAAVRRRFSGIYGNTDGCHPADLEVAEEMLDVYAAIHDYELDGKLSET